MKSLHYTCSRTTKYILNKLSLRFQICIIQNMSGVERGETKNVGTEANELSMYENFTSEMKGRKAIKHLQREQKKKTHQTKNRNFEKQHRHKGSG